MDGMDTTTALTEITAFPLFTIFSGRDNWEVVKFQEVRVEGAKKIEVRSFNATGTNLPNNKTAIVSLQGTWKETKYGNTFDVVSFHVKEITSEKGVVSYLGSLHIGFGVAKAKAIWNLFGDNTWDILNDAPETIKGFRYGKKGVFSETDVELLKKALDGSKAEREVIALLNPYFIPVGKIKKLIEFLHDNDMPILETIKTDIYACKPLDFPTMERIAADFGISADNEKRLSSASNHVFSAASVSGHLCLPLKEYLKQMDALLKKYRRNAGVSMETLQSYINSQCKAKEMIYQRNGDMLYPMFRWEQETGIAKEIRRIQKNGQKTKMREEEIAVLIERFEQQNKITLSPGQKQAVLRLSASPVGVLTGGPGTGKSTITKALLYVQKEQGKSYNPVLLAPTGRAARRMSECNDGVPASTIHSAILYAGEDNANGNVQTLAFEPLEGSVFIVDEVSMMDEAIAYELLRRIPNGASIIFVGDPDQLPSVGAGHVLSEVLRSEAVPVVELTDIFRQSGNGASLIIENAAKIRTGDLNLQFDTQSFCFCPTDTPERTEQAACSFYLKCVRKFGQDNVLLLNAYRNKSRVNVDRFNSILRNTLNPDTGQRHIKIRSKLFRVGDRVMQTKNTQTVKNGDIGIILSIENDITSIEFNNGEETVSYDREEMQNVDLAYCSTVHKAQGQESDVIILVCDAENPMGLQRNLLYTGITRAKKHVILVGQYDSLCKAISNTRQQARNTLLSSCIRKYVSD